MAPITRWIIISTIETCKDWIWLNLEKKVVRIFEDYKLEPERTEFGKPLRMQEYFE